MRALNSVLIIGGDLTPENYLLISRMIPHVKRLFLTGKLGLKFFSVDNEIKIDSLNLTES
jgi:hypothetical protein